MRITLIGLLALYTLTGCRSSRATVEVMDPNAPKDPVDDDYNHIPGSVQTSVKISALSLPTGPRSYDRLELAVRKAGTTEDRVRKIDYSIGELIPIEAHLRYDIILSAWTGTTEIYSTRYCVQRQGFLAEEGVNAFTAALCAKP